MLNLSKSVIYDRAQKDHVKALVERLGKSITSGGRSIRVNGPFLWGLQDADTKAIKHSLSFRTLKYQFCRCAFCEVLLRDGDADLEHIVPKSRHGEYTYEPLNIVSSCGSCNSKRKKGDTDTVKLPLAGRYKDCR